MGRLFDGSMDECGQIIGLDGWIDGWSKRKKENGLVLPK
jgi:hypothetical protein